MSSDQAHNPEHPWMLSFKGSRRAQTLSWAGWVPLSVTPDSEPARGLCFLGVLAAATFSNCTHLF